MTEPETLTIIVTEAEYDAIAEQKPTRIEQYEHILGAGDVRVAQIMSAAHHEIPAVIAVSEDSMPIPPGIDLERGQKAIPCACGGYCDALPGDAFTQQEVDKLKAANACPCCCVVFQCRQCQARYFGTYPAPEADAS